MMQAVNRDRSGLAIDGYDPVVYFVEGRAARGRTDFEYAWNGARYRFASEANRDRFVKSPEVAVAYGGFCCTPSVADTPRTSTQTPGPSSNGKLYLDYSVRVQRTWEEDVPGNVRRADANWSALRDKQE